MIKYLIAVLVVIFGILALIYLFVGVPPVYREEIPEIKTPHLYNNSAGTIARIKITAFYFIPKNKTDFIIEDWREVLEQNLRKLQQFHSLQFQGRSLIIYEIYPEPIFGREESVFYDTEITQFGNPQGLRNVASEIKERVFTPAGDLYRSDFAQKGEDFYSSVIMYEGVGASAGEDAAFISSTYLFNQEYKEFGTSVLAHEFYHTIGIPDAYEIPTSVPTSGDIMGSGRFQPIEKTYLARSTLKALGL